MAAAGNSPVLVSDPSENEAPSMLAGTLIVTCMALITMGARAFVRLGIIKNFGWDDAFMAFAMALTTAGQGIVIAEVSYGGGRHIGDVPPAKYMIGMKLNFITQPLFLIAICIVKLSIGSSLLRIASTKFWKTIIMSIMGFMTFYTIGCFFTIMFQCTDIRILWDSSVKGTCWTQRTLQALSYTNLALNVITDLLFAIIIPGPMLWGLNVNRRTRWTLLGILGLGIFACVACLIKLSYLVNYGKLGDWLWDSRNITIWTVVECNIGIVAGNLPTLRPLFKTILGSSYGKNSRKTGGQIGSGYYAKGTVRSTKANWQTLGSGRRTDPVDETSSERAFNAGVESYEMGRGNGTVVLTQVDAKSSDESLELPMANGRGIMKTTTTTTTFVDAKKS